MTLEVGLFLVLLDVVPVAARVDLPVERRQIVAGQVLPVLGELDAEALVGAAMQPGQESFDHRPRLQLHGAQPRDDGRIQEPQLARGGGHGHGYIPLCGSGHGGEQPLDDGVGRDPLRLGVEVRNHAVPEDGQRQRLDVGDRDVIAAVDERAGLARQNQRLRRPQSGAPLDPVGHELVRALPSGPRGVDEPDGIARDLFRDDHLPHELLDLEDLRSAQHPLRRMRRRRRSSA